MVPGVKIKEKGRYTRCNFFSLILFNSLTTNSKQAYYLWETKATIFPPTTIFNRQSSREISARNISRRLLYTEIVIEKRVKKIPQVKFLYLPV